MAEHGRQGASRLATALNDVVEGTRVVSHNSLALLGLCSAVIVALLVGSPQWRHQAEERALTWLMDRANARMAAAEVEPEETPDARIKRFRVLTALHPDHVETKQLLAELSIAAEDFPAARRALGDLPSSQPTRRILAIMAAVERGEGADDTVVRGWLTRALTAPRGKQWICDTCQSVHEEWGPVCPNCGGFDTLSWRDAPHATTTLPHGAEMLPLIVGKPQIDEAEEVEEPVAEDAQVAETSDVEEAEVLPLDDAVAMARKTV